MITFVVVPFVLAVTAQIGPSPFAFIIIPKVIPILASGAKIQREANPVMPDQELVNCVGLWRYFLIQPTTALRPIEALTGAIHNARNTCAP